MICANDGCENEFVKTTHNQKYCCDDCCREATNAKIKQKNQERKDRLSGKKRVCKTRGCSTILSKYEEGNICDYCNSKKKTQEQKELFRIIGYGNF